jgi:hypothetical protein
MRHDTANISRNMWDTANKGCSELSILLTAGDFSLAAAVASIDAAEVYVHVLKGAGAVR